MNTNNISNKKQVPIVLIIFGITGDLIKTYVLDSLYSLFLDNKFVQGSKIICFIRREWEDKDLREYLEKVMKDSKYQSPERYSEFLELFEVSIGSFNKEDSFKKLNKRIQDIENDLGQVIEKIYYLAISPEHFGITIQNIGESGKDIFSEDSFREIKLIIEKPFGLDLDDAIYLDDLISKYFKDEQIFRVDHYLAKFTLRYLEEISFEKEFGEKFALTNAEKIHIKMLENLGVEGRISFYEKIGALRDTGQNHLLEVFATLLTSQSPRKELSFIDNRLASINSLRVIPESKVKEQVTRLQAKEYLNIKGINKHSNTETYFKINTITEYFDKKKLDIVLEGGKYQNETLFSIEITYPEYILIMKLKPIKVIQLWTRGEACTLSREIKISTNGTHSEYYNIFLETCGGNSKYFVSKEEVVSQWKFVHPILKYWKENPINEKSDKSKSAWRLLILGYVLILLLCLIVILQMTR